MAHTESPVWAPTLEEVAGVIPTRTTNTNLPGETRFLNTFNDDTVPNAEQAQRFIDRAVELVNHVVTSIYPALEPLAKSAALWRAAADIELAYPRRNADVSIYTQLNERAELEWNTFISANSVHGVTSETIPQWYMPEPVWYGDRTDI